MKNVFITGTSSGIGYSVSEMLISKGYRIFGTVRKEEDAKRVREKLGENYIPVLCDVSQPEDIRKAFDEVKQALSGEILNGIINNAGIGIGGPVRYQSIDEIRTVFEVNFFGLLNVIQTFFPLLIHPDSPLNNGRIINVSSVAGKVGYPFLGAYVASKHAVEGLTDSLRRECLVNQIKVILIEPGDTRTSIWDKAEQQDPDIYKHTEYYPILKKFKKMFIKKGKTGIPVEHVAGKIVHALETKRPKPRYTIPNGRLSWWITRYLPDRTVDKIMQKVVGLYPSTLPRQDK